MSAEAMPQWAAEGFHAACVARDKAIEERAELLLACEALITAIKSGSATLQAAAIAKGEAACIKARWK